MLLPYRPEAPLNETLRFLTDILVHADGSEQRVCLRTGPRTEYNCEFLIEDGSDRDIFENYLYGNEAGTWSIPAWPEWCTLTSAATSGASTVAVDHSLADFRAGSQAIIYQDEANYEVLNAITLGSGTIGFSGVLANSWPAGTDVYPLRDAQIVGPASVRRYPSNATTYGIHFAALDASVDLYTGTLPAGSTLTFATLGFGTDTNVLVLSDPNAMDAQTNESYTMQSFGLDGHTGKFSQVTFWAQAQKGSQKGFVIHNRSDLWAVRVLLHRLKGRQESFFLPSFAKDLVPTAGVTSGGNTLTVVNCGFTTYAAGKTRKYIRLEKTDGTHLDNQIASSSITSPTVETVTLSNNWPATVALADIARITIYERVRLSADDVVLKHASLNGEATISFGVVGVFD